MKAAHVEIANKIINELNTNSELRARVVESVEPLRASVYEVLGEDLATVIDGTELYINVVDLIDESGSTELYTQPIQVPQQYDLTEQVVEEIKRLLAKEQERCDEILVDFSLGLRSWNAMKDAENTLAIIDEAFDQIK